MARTARKRGWLRTSSDIERMLSDKRGFAIKLTPVQQAICRAIDGVPLDKLWQFADVKRAFGCAPVTEWGSCIPGTDRPFEVYVCAGIRGGKTSIAAAVAIDRAIHADLSWWHEAETPPIVPLLATRKHNAGAAFSAVRRLLTKKDSLVGDYYVRETKESITVRHAERPECLIDIQIMAGSRAGSNLESFWIASCIFDEAFKMQGREDSTINLEDAQVAVRERILPHGQILYIGSPWAPQGPAYQVVKDSWNKSNQRLLVVRAPGPMLNPVWWTSERIERLKSSTDRRDRENYITSGLGEFLDPESALLSADAVAACTRERPVEVGPQPDVEYVAAMDPATRRNAWTLVIGSKKSADKITVDVAREWIPTAAEPLEPEVVLRDVAAICAKYKIVRVWTDQYSVDANRNIAQGFGISLLEHKSKDTWDLYDPVRVAVVTRSLDLPPIDRLSMDLTRVVKRPTSAGMRIILPTTADGRHCDFVPPIALLLAHPPPLASKVIKLVETDETRLLAELERQGRCDLELIGSRL